MTYNELLAKHLLLYLCVEYAGSHKTCTLDTSMGVGISFNGNTLVADYDSEYQLLSVYSSGVIVFNVSQESFEIILAEVRALQEQVIWLVAHSKDPLET